MLAILRFARSVDRCVIDRQPLVIALVVSLALAGCIGVPASNEAPSTSTDSADTPEACPDDVERLDPGVETGSLPERDAGFAISADRTTVERGEQLGVTLENVDDEPRATGTERLFVLQRHVDGQWETVIGAPEDHRGWNATLIVHDPGNGYDWTATMSADAFSTGGYEVCGSLPPGEYRFVYHALTEPGEYDDTIPDPSVAVEFTLVE